MQGNYLKAVVLMVLMLAVAAIAAIFKPTHLMANDSEPMHLESAIPKEFSGWKMIEANSGQVINPEQSEMLNKIYTQLLTRTYKNEDGDLIMVSIAYGENQSEETALHYPEICYPAQGFQLVNSKLTNINTSFGKIRAKQLEMVISNRHESITYWTLLGNLNVLGTKETKLKRFEFALNNQIPDGLIFRVSSIGDIPEKEFETQNTFINSLIKNLDTANRKRIISF